MARVIRHKKATVEHKVVNQQERLKILLIDSHESTSDKALSTKEMLQPIVITESHPITLALVWEVKTAVITTFRDTIVKEM